MDIQPQIVTIFGGSGFVGKYITQQMARAGWRVRVAVRRPQEAIHVKTLGGVGQVEPIQANIRDEDSTRAAIAGADAVINCVGLLQESGSQTFEALHVQGAERIARLSAEAGIARLVHISALGADPLADSAYASTKGKGEAAVLKAFPEAVILRPSVIFGTEDNFFNRFATLARYTLVIPVVGADSLLQPVYVDDVAAAAKTAVLDASTQGVYELGGPDKASLRELLKYMLEIIQRRRLILNLPFFVGSIMGNIWDFAAKVSMGIFTNTILTADQVKQLRHDNVVAEDARTLADLGVVPTGMEAVLPEYLYAHRLYGQYAEITASAENLAGIRRNRSTAK